MAQSHPWLVFILLLAIATGYARDLREGKQHVSKADPAAQGRQPANVARQQLWSGLIDVISGLLSR
jgi:hypothetical protein